MIFMLFQHKDTADSCRLRYTIVEIIYQIPPCQSDLMQPKALPGPAKILRRSQPGDTLKVVGTGWATLE